MTILYNGNPDGLLTYTSPSPKLCMGPSGTYRYGPHNLYVNSASPANQSITVVSGAAYTVVITGSVSVTASGAATGTWTAGTTNFTAATGTLTLGSTSGAGTVHVRRTNSDTTYLQTGASARYGLPFEWNSSAVLQGILVEEARTNLFLNNRVPVTQTCTVTNAASYTVSFFGTGSITFSGANSSTLNGTGASNRVATTFTTTSTSLTCTVSGSIDLVQVEIGAFATSPIETFGATVTRAADNISLAASAFPYGAAAGTLFAQFSASNSDMTSGSVYYAAALDDGSINNTIGLYRYQTNIGAAVAASGATQSDQYRAPGSPTSPHKDAVSFASNDIRQATDGVLSTPDTSATIPTATKLSLSRANNNQINGYLAKVMYLPRSMSNAELQALTT